MKASTYVKQLKRNLGSTFFESVIIDKGDDVIGIVIEKMEFVYAYYVWSEKKQDYQTNIEPELWRVKSIINQNYL